MTEEERYQYILHNHMGRWHTDNILLFKEASRISGDPVEFFYSKEDDYIWLIRVNKNESYKRFWIYYRTLLRDSKK